MYVCFMNYIFWMALFVVLPNDNMHLSFQTFLNIMTPAITASHDKVQLFTFVMFHWFCLSLFVLKWCQTFGPVQIWQNCCLIYNNLIINEFTWFYNFMQMCKYTRLWSWWSLSDGSSKKHKVEFSVLFSTMDRDVMELLAVISTHHNTKRQPPWLWKYQKPLFLEQSLEPYYRACHSP